jgi:hypothetical protein
LERDQFDMVTMSVRMRLRRKQWRNCEHEEQKKRTTREDEKAGE